MRREAAARMAFRANARFGNPLVRVLDGRRPFSVAFSYFTGSAFCTQTEIDWLPPTSVKESTPQWVPFAPTRNTGSVVVGAHGGAALVVSNLDAAPSGKTYEAWVISGGAPKPAGVFSRSSVILLTRPVTKGSVVAMYASDG